MDAKLEGLLKMGFEATYTRERLDEPFSIRQDGEIATVADVLREFGTDEVRAAFGLPKPDGTQSVKSVNVLTEDEWARLTVMMYESEGDGVALSSGSKTYSMKDVIEEVRQRTPFGRETIEATKRHSQLVEEAIRRGKAKLIVAEALEDIDTILKDF